MRFLLTLLIALGAAPVAGAAVTIRNLDTTGAPTVRLTVVTSAPAREVPSVFENGSAVTELVGVDLGREKRIVLAVDHSQSMHGRSLRDAVDAARRFVALGQAGDQFAVLTFASQVSVAAGFAPPSVNAGALNGLTVDPHYGTRLYDAVVDASRLLSRVVGSGRVLVLVTDGQETTSRATLQQAIRAARRAHVSVYPIAIESTAFSPEPLRTLAARTGGTYHGARSSAELSSIYTSLSNELRRTWQLHYLTAARPGDRIQVDVHVPGQGGASRTTDLRGTASTGTGSSGTSPWLLAAVAVLAALMAILVMPSLLAGIAERRSRPRYL